MVARGVLRHLHPLFDAAHRLRRAAAREAARQRFKACGRNVVFDPLSSDIDYEQISVGSDVYIGWGAYLFGPIDIGDDVIFGPEVHVQAGYHRIDLVGSTIRASGGDVREKVTIGHDVWVAARATILKGVTVGDGAVVATGAVVTRDVEPYTIVAGNPARVLRPRFTAADLERHLAMRTPLHRRSGSSLPSP